MKTVDRLENQEYKGTLEEFLSSFYDIIEKYRNESLTGSLLTDILREAWSTPSAKIKYECDYEDPLNEKDSDDGYLYLRHVLLRQIQDLHRMRRSGALEGMEYQIVPIISPTGNSWYNLSVNHFISVLEPHPDSLNSNFTWKEIADYLYEAQIYE